jgi:hypothetical protein
VNPEKKEKLRRELGSYYGYCRSFLLKSDMSLVTTTWLLIVSRVGSPKSVVLRLASELPWITIDFDCTFSVLEIILVWAHSKGAGLLEASGGNIFVLFLIVDSQ